MRRLIIIAGSKRQNSNPQPLPAIERYEGVYFRVLKKHIREGKMKNTDILILTEKYGLLSSNQLVPYNPEYSPRIATNNLNDARRRNLQKLQQELSKEEYLEIFINVGKDFWPLIEGLENVVGKTKVTLAKGSALGSKASNMKQWILKHASRADKRS